MGEANIGKYARYEHIRIIEKAIKVDKWQKDSLVYFKENGQNHVGDFDEFYWSYIFKTIPEELVTDIISDNLIWMPFGRIVKSKEDYLGDDEVREVTEKIIANCESLSANSSKLLLDPRVALRYEDFVAFLSEQNNGAKDLIELRRLFIDWLDNKHGKRVVYRGYLLESEGDFRENSHLSPVIAKVCSGDKALFDFLDKRNFMLAYHDEYGDAPHSPNDQLPIIGSFSSVVSSHLRDNASRSVLMSGSGSKKVVEFALENGSQRNSALLTEKKLEKFIYRFEVSYFYALPRAVVAPHTANPDANKDDFMRSINEIGVSFTDETYEYFFIFSVPVGFNDQANRV